MAKSKPPLTEDELRELLRAECEKAGSQTAWAQSADVSTAYVSDVINGRRQPGDSILRALGYKRRVEYVSDAWDEPRHDAWATSKRNKP